MTNHRLLSTLVVSVLLGAPLFVAAGTASAAGTVDTVVNTITTDSKPTEVKVSPDGKTLYVSFYSDAKVEAFDIATGIRKWSTPVAVNPLPLEVSPDGLWVYQLSGGGGESLPSLSRLDAVTGHVNWTAPLSRSQPWDSEINSAGTVLFIANAGGRTISRVDLVKAFAPGYSYFDYEIVAEVVANVEDLALSADGSLVYVSSARYPSQLRVYDADTLAEQPEAEHIIVPEEACATVGKLSTSPDGRYLYVSCTQPDIDSDTDLDTRKFFLLQITLADSTSVLFPLDASAGDSVVTPDGSKVYVAVEAEVLNVVDVSKETVSQIAGVPYAAFGLALNPAGDRLFAATWGGPTENKFVKIVDTGVFLGGQLSDLTQTCAATLQQGTAISLTDLTSTTTVRRGVTIYKSITPSTFFYWARVNLPATTPTTVVTQTVDAGTITLRGTRGSVLYDANCGVVKGAKFTYGSDGSASVSAAAAGSYIVAVKFTASGLVGTPSLNRVFTFDSTAGPWYRPELRLE